MKRYTPLFSAGFSLIELMVSISIFAIVMVMIIGSYLVILSVNAQAQATATGTDNLAFALEAMTRLIRTGNGYSCGAVLGAGDCGAGNPGTSFTFRDVGSRTVTYSLSGTSITETVDGGTPYTLTESSVTITKLNFIVNGSSPADTLAPTVQILIGGNVIGTKSQILTFSIETSATMRGIDQ